MVFEKRCLKLFKYAFKKYQLEQNNASKQKVGHCDTTTLPISIFTILNTYVSLIFHAKIQPKISSGSGEEVDLLLLFF